MDHKTDAEKNNYQAACAYYKHVTSKHTLANAHTHTRKTHIHTHTHTNARHTHTHTHTHKRKT